MTEGIGQAFAKGVQGYIAGQQQGQDRQARQQALTQQAEQFRMQQGQYQQQTTAHEQQMQLMQEQLKAAQAQNEQNARVASMDRLYNAFKSDTPIAELNHVIAKDKMLQTHPSFKGVYEIEELPLDSSELSNALSQGMERPVRVRKLVDGKPVSGVADLETLKLGLGYKTYAKKRELEAKKNQVESLTTSIDLNALTKAAAANPNMTVAALVESMKPKKATEQKAEMEVEGLKKEQAIKTYINENHKDFINSLDKPGVVIKVGDKELGIREVAEMAQGDAKLPTGEEGLLTGLYDARTAFRTLKTELNDPNLNWDAISKGMEELKKVDPADFISMSQKEKDALANKFAFNSKLKTAMAAYIKAMSGAAVSDEERDFYTDAMTSGNWSNKEAAQASIGGFIEGVDRSLNNRLDIHKNKYPLDYLNYKELMRIGTTKPVTSAPKKLVNKVLTKEEISAMSRDQKIAYLESLRGN